MSHHARAWHLALEAWNWQINNFPFTRPRRRRVGTISSRHHRNLIRHNSWYCLLEMLPPALQCYFTVWRSWMKAGLKTFFFSYCVKCYIRTWSLCVCIIYSLNCLIARNRWPTTICWIYSWCFQEVLSTVWWTFPLIGSLSSPQALGLKAKVGGDETLLATLTTISDALLGNTAGQESPVMNRSGFLETYSHS
jgi:hypothetical protein